MTAIETSHAQQGIWFTEQAGLAAGAYHLAWGIRFGPGLDEAALAEACAAVVERHEILRTAVAVDDGVPVLIPAAEKIALTFGDLDDERVHAEVTRPFDLGDGPLARLTLLTAGPGRSLLLITAHHLVFDGVSKDVFTRELSAAYHAAMAGRPVGLAPLPPSAPAATQREQVAATLPLARAYWQANPVPTTDLTLPGLRRVPAGASAGGTVRVPVAPGVAGRLGEAVRRLGCTRFELLLTAVHTLLARYGNVGLPVTVALSTRTGPTAHSVGMFVNELPLTVAPSCGTVREDVHRLRERLREVYRIRAVPFAHAVGGVRPAAALSAVSVSYRRQASEPVFPGVEASVDWSIPSAVVRNALNLLIVDAPSGLRITVEHSLDAIPVEAAARIAGHLATVLAAVIEDPDRSTTMLPILPAAERDQVLRAWNATERPFPPDATVPALFRAAVERRPAAVAVTDGGVELTYAEVDAASARLAERLREHGVGSGALVAVCLPRSWQAVIALLAIMRCHAAYVPVDPAYPAARRALILLDAAPVLTITSTATAGTAGEHPVLTFDTLDTLGPPPTGPGAPPATHDPAYVMYTSGSTGRPKGVTISHGALANLLLGMRDLLGSEPQDRWLSLTSLSFDISGLELFLPLVSGARVVIAAEGSAVDGHAVGRLIRDQGVTHVQATPSGWRILLDAGLDGRGVVALSGGEALPLPLARQLRTRVARLFNVYGPTETTIWSTAEELPDPVDEVSIGRPIANTRVYVLDDAHRPVPVGTTGELYIGGHGVADGYLRNQVLTAERFIPSPFVAGDRLYRTGDRCEWLPDGRLAYAGRSDNQVKVRGHRLELGEIEARLLEHPAVAQAAVVLRPPVGGDDPQRLVAYVVPRGQVPDPADLRRHLAETLPGAAVPDLFATLDRLPLTPNGKLDRAALPDPPRHPTGAAAAPRARDGADPLMAELTSIWQDVLKVDEIGPDEDLFDLGGHSLSIARISGRIKQRFGVDVRMDAFFDAPTVAEIATIVRTTLDDAAGRR